MSIRIDVPELLEVLRQTPAGQNIMLMGKHGIGKSEIITRFYLKQSMDVVPFFCGQMSDPGDLIGLMHKDEQSGRSVFLPPYWWPKPGIPIVLFLDELNRARPEILQAVHDLALNKTLAGKKLPQGSIVIAAVNEGDEYQLTDLDPALVSRFNLYEFAPSVEDWLVWAENRELDKRVITFIQKNRHQLDGQGITPHDAGMKAGLVKLPDRRAWARVSEFILHIKQIEDLHIKIIAGMVGTPAALAFKLNLGTLEKVSAQQILLNFDKYKNKLKKLSIQETVLLNEQMILWINSQKYKTDQEDTIRKNLLEYLKALHKAKNHEPVAHFASMIENSGFENVMAFASESIEIITLITDYIQGIKV